MGNAAVGGMKFVGAFFEELWEAVREKLLVGSGSVCGVFWCVLGGGVGRSAGWWCVHQSVSVICGLPNTAANPPHRDHSACRQDRPPPLYPPPPNPPTSLTTRRSVIARPSFNKFSSRSPAAQCSMTMKIWRLSWKAPMKSQTWGTLVRVAVGRVRTG